MRLFIALPLPKDTIQSLRHFQEPVRGIKWQETDQMHLTLRFLGGASQTQLIKLKNKLRSIKAQTFSMTVDHVGVFPNRHSPRVIWAGIRKSPPLLNLQQMIEKRCQSVGFEAETRPFKPHITLGRVKKASKKRVVSLLKSEKANALFLQADIDQFNLYRSELKSSGAVHHVVEKYFLGELD